MKSGQSESSSANGIGLMSRCSTGLNRRPLPVLAAGFDDVVEVLGRETVVVIVCVVALPSCAVVVTVVVTIIDNEVFKDTLLDVVVVLVLVEVCAPRTSPPVNGSLVTGANKPPTLVVVVSAGTVPLAGRSRAQRQETRTRTGSCRSCFCGRGCRCLGLRPEQPTSGSG